MKPKGESIKGSIQKPTRKQPKLGIFTQEYLLHNKLFLYKLEYFEAFEEPR